MTDDAPGILRQIARAIFRHGAQDTPRNRVQAINANVFLHLHPTVIPRAALRLT